MWVNSLSFKNYRNLSEDTVRFSQKTNIVYGENAQGKTNIIEALWLLTGARSFRGTRDRDLISFGCDSAEISGEIEFFDRTNNIEICLSQGKRTALVNGVKRGPAPTIIGLFKAVVFSPEHLSLVKGGPENRRKLIDAAICQIKPTYPALLVRYNKVLRQRNTLLKNDALQEESKKLLDVWDKKAAEYSGDIIFERIKYINKLNEQAKTLYYQMSGGETLDICYSNQEEYVDLSKSEIKKRLLEQIIEARRTDKLRGFTTVGAHRDEIHININQKPAKTFGSQGQQRSAIIAIKLAEAGIIEEDSGEKPVILLDDILSELDEKRQKQMFDSLASSQVVITGCVEPTTDAKYKAFKVTDGKIKTY